MNERIKEIRAELKMNQTEFAKKLGIGQSTLAMMEVNKRDFSDRHIKTVCAIFNVNEQWLRTGAGEMFVETEDSLVSQLAQEYKLGELERSVIEGYLGLSDEDKGVVRRWLEKIVESKPKPDPKKDEIDRKTAEFRAELEAEEKGVDAWCPSPGAKEA